MSSGNQQLRWELVRHSHRLLEALPVSLPQTHKASETRRGVVMRKSQPTFTSRY